MSEKDVFFYCLPVTGAFSPCQERKDSRNSNSYIFVFNPRKVASQANKTVLLIILKIKAKNSCE